MTHTSAGMSLAATALGHRLPALWQRIWCCLMLGAALTAGELTPVALQLNWFHQFQFAGYYAADLKGFYRDEGLQVAIKEYQVGLDPATALLAGTADYAIT